MKTNFSFELQYPAASTASQAQRKQLMQSLAPTLQTLFESDDSAARITVSDSHRGSENRMLELVTTLSDARIAEILKRFCDQHGVAVSAIE